MILEARWLLVAVVKTKIQKQIALIRFLRTVGHAQERLSMFIAVMKKV